MRRLAAVLISCMCLFLGLAMAGCGPRLELREEFQEFAARRVQEADLQRSMGVVLDPYWLVLEREATERSPSILLTWMLRTELEAGYVLNHYDVEADLKFLAELARDFSREMKWPLGSHIYVELWAPTFVYMYDAQRDYLHSPQNGLLLKEVLRTYGTMRPDAIAKTEEGRRFLLNSGLAGGDPVDDLARFRGDFIIRDWKWFRDFRPKRSVVMAEGVLYKRKMSSVGRWEPGWEPD